MQLVGNILWFTIGLGFLNGTAWFILGGLAYISVIGIPWGHACFVIGNLAYFPFGRMAVERSLIQKEEDTGTGKWGVMGNVIWVLVFGWLIALTSIISGIMFFLTIIGIPFSLQYFKLAGLALVPIGKEIVSKEMGEVLLKEKAEAKLQAIRNRK